MMFKFFLSAIVLCWQTSVAANTATLDNIKLSNNKISGNGIVKTVMTEYDEVVDRNEVKFIQIEVVELTDNSGLTYIGGKVSAADLSPYLAKMKQIVGDDFALYRQNQSVRDHSTFHMTLINPYEYQLLKEKVKIGANLAVSLLGLGRVNVDDKTTYFVVAESSQAEIFRQHFALTKKDFHITLGFSPNDIYGVNKGIESLVK